MSCSFAFLSVQGVQPRRRKQFLWRSSEKLALSIPLHLRETKMQSGCAWRGLQQPGGLPSGEFLARCFPVEWWTRKTCCSLLPCPCRGMGYAGVGQLCPFLLETSALGTRLHAAQRLSFWELGSQSFPACLSFYSSFRKGVVRAENTFMRNHCNTPYFFPFFFFCQHLIHFSCRCSHQLLWHRV